MLRAALPCLPLLVAAACQTPPPDASAAFVTLLGQDTLAAEQYTRSEEVIRAEVVLRTPVVARQTYALFLDDAGHMTRFESEKRPALGGDIESQLITRYDDGFAVATTRQGETRIDSIEAPAEALPFLDMLHWPFDLMLERGYAAPGGVYEQPLLVGNQALNFEIRRLSADSVTVTHPFRGTMGVDVDAAGHLEQLDAAGTTRKLKVFRKPAIDLEALAARFASIEASGRRFGDLSGRGETAATIDGATILIDYGQPLKRGRVIFGELVPYGTVWRTGANRATHFRTDRALQFGNLTVPAGEYTLFTIPAPDGGVLIFNTQTGQGGTTYDAERDLGRVPLAVNPLEQVVEPFTIAVEPANDGGVLQLMWDRTALVAPFRVR
ncbi:MAG: DUF2911 domain-containing protein [Rhodothermales bacterium]